MSRKPHSERLALIREALEYQERESMVGPLFPEALAALDSHEEQFETSRRLNAELRLRFRRTLRDEGWRDEAIEELLVEAERASNPAQELTA